MAITPEETDILTDIELGILSTCEEKIDELLRQKWERGIKCGFPLKPIWRDELINELMKRYRIKGWQVIHDAQNGQLIITA